ncbi:hypothetical protein Taro_024573 [Colocasia esculenta]|uniref:Uncharacterized protein n=1 Tax=Colocasia esculenta TaxID=4460 RepID=A0A843V9S2_COLES|nr:hypothetical protein [Colocasia esculenta]
MGGGNRPNSELLPYCVLLQPVQTTLLVVDQKHVWDPQRVSSMKAATLLGAILTFPHFAGDYDVQEEEHVEDGNASE